MDIKIITLDERADVAYEYFGLPQGDRTLFSAVLEVLSELGEATSINKFTPFLNDWEHPICLWRLKSLITYCILKQHFQVDKGVKGFTPEYCAWVTGYGTALLALAKLTKDYDPWIQHILNYEDFLFYELQHTQGGKRVVCEFYDLRGIDFFLIHFMNGSTTALADAALFQSARLVPECLASVGRTEEASLVAREIDDREESLKQIVTDYSPPRALSLPSTLDYLRLLAERFWVDYLSPTVWAKCSDTSRQDLIDAFVAEFMLQKGILRGWSQAVLSLCKVIEREMAQALFSPWVERIRSASFAVPNGLSPANVKRAETRRITFQVLQSCAKQPSHPPTLGQLLFVAKFWNDDIMDLCTDLFLQMRTETSRWNPSYSDGVKRVTELCEEEHEVDGERPTVTDLRNAAAHPGRERDFTWPQYIDWLKEFLGRPPRELLRLLFELRKPL